MQAVTAGRSTSHPTEARLAARGSRSAPVQSELERDEAKKSWNGQREAYAPNRPTSRKQIRSRAYNRTRAGMAQAPRQGPGSPSRSGSGADRLVSGFGRTALGAASALQQTPKKDRKSAHTVGRARVTEWREKKID